MRPPSRVRPPGPAGSSAAPACRSSSLAHPADRVQRGDDQRGDPRRAGTSRRGARGSPRGRGAAAYSTAPPAPIAAPPFVAFLRLLADLGLREPDLVAEESLPLLQQLAEQSPSGRSRRSASPSWRNRAERLHSSRPSRCHGSPPRHGSGADSGRRERALLVAALPVTAVAPSGRRRTAAPARSGSPLPSGRRPCSPSRGARTPAPATKQADRTTPGRERKLRSHRVEELVRGPAPQELGAPPGVLGRIPAEPVVLRRRRRRARAARRAVPSADPGSRAPARGAVRVSSVAFSFASLAAAALRPASCCFRTVRDAGCRFPCVHLGLVPIGCPSTDGGAVAGVRAVTPPPGARRFPGTAAASGRRAPAGTTCRDGTRRPAPALRRRAGACAVHAAPLSAAGRTG